MKILACITSSTLLLLFSGTAWSTGYFLFGYGTKHRGYAGAGVAIAEDASSIATNPAAAVGLSGTELSLGTTVLTSPTELEVGPVPDGLAAGSRPLRAGSYDHEPDVPLQYGGVFAVPSGAISHRSNQHWAMGLAFYGNGGLNTTYEDFPNESCPAGTRGTGVFCGGALSSDLGQFFVAPTLAWEPVRWLRLGVSPLLVWQVLEVRGLQNASGNSINADRFSNQGHDHAFGYGVKAGFQMRLLPGLSLGLAAQSRIHMQEFDKYSGLLPEQGRAEIPPQYQLGIAWDITDSLTLVADRQEIFYTETAATGNAVAAAAPGGSDDGPGFGWSDNRSYKFGLRWKASPNWVFRASYFETDGVIGPDELYYDLTATAILTKGYGVGFSRTLPGKSSLDFAMHYFPRQSVDSENPFAPGQSLSVNQRSLAFDVGWSRRF